MEPCDMAFCDARHRELFDQMRRDAGEMGYVRGTALIGLGTMEFRGQGDGLFKRRVPAVSHGAKLPDRERLDQRNRMGPPASAPCLYLLPLLVGGDVTQ